MAPKRGRTAVSASDTSLIPAFNYIEPLNAIGVDLDTMVENYETTFASYDTYTQEKRNCRATLELQQAAAAPGTATHRCTFKRIDSDAFFLLFDLKPRYAQNRDPETWPASDMQLEFLDAACAAVRAEEPDHEDLQTTSDVLKLLKDTVNAWRQGFEWDHFHHALFLYFHEWPMAEVRTTVHCSV